MITGYLTELDDFKTIKLRLNYPKMEESIKLKLSEHQNDNLTRDITTEVPKIVDYSELVLRILGLNNQKISILFFNELINARNIEVVKWIDRRPIIYLQNKEIYNNKVRKRAQKTQTSITIAVL